MLDVQLSMLSGSLRWIQCSLVSSSIRLTVQQRDELRCSYYGILKSIWFVSNQ